MLDTLKFAFEILLVGVLTLPAIAVLVEMFPGSASANSGFSLSVVPKQARDAVAVALVVAFGYVLGSAVSRVSRNFFNEDMWWAGWFPTEHSIREAVYKDEYCKEHILKDLILPHLAVGYGNPLEEKWFCPRPDGHNQDSGGQRFTAGGAADVTTARIPAHIDSQSETRTSDPTNRVEDPEERRKHFNRRVEELFSLQESRLLLSGQDRVDRLRQYYDQITVLRGAAFDGFVLFAICTFGFCRNWRERWSERKLLASLAYIPPGFAVLHGAYSLWALKDRMDGSADLGGWEFVLRHPPFAEFVWIFLGLAGIAIVNRAIHTTGYLRAWLVAGFLTFGSFCGWWWTEVMYDLQIIHSRPSGYTEWSDQAGPNTGAAQLK
jgi:hypothetical protein